MLKKFKLTKNLLNLLKYYKKMSSSNPNLNKKVRIMRNFINIRSLFILI